MAKCRDPRRCGKCWENGHTDNNCRQANLNPAAKPFKPEETLAKTFEPRFDKLFVEEHPYSAPLILEGRPQTISCFIDRDEAYFKELKTLTNSVIMHNVGLQRDLSPDNVADIAAKTRLVSKADIQVSSLSGPRYLTKLPDELAPDTFIKAVPAELWGEGLSFQPWTPLDDATIIIPRFKIIVDLIGVHVTL